MTWWQVLFLVWLLGMPVAWFVLSQRNDKDPFVGVLGWPVIVLALGLVVAGRESMGWIRRRRIERKRTSGSRPTKGLEPTSTADSSVKDSDDPSSTRNSGSDTPSRPWRPKGQ